MVGYTVNTGSSEDFAEGWDRVFGGGKRPKVKAKSKAKPKGKGKRGKSSGKKSK